MKQHIAKLLLPIGLISSVYSDEDDYRKDNRFSILGEVVFMHRSGGKYEVLAADSSILLPMDNQEVITSKALVHRFEYEPGFRVGFNAILDDYRSIEGNFMWLAQWEGRKSAGGDGTLYFPFENVSYTNDYYQADAAVAIYKSNFYSAEINYWQAVTPRFSNYFGFSGLFGLRYMNLREHLNLAYTKGVQTSNYLIDTENALIGGQAGADLQWNPTTYLSWDFFMKVGAFVNLAEQKTLLKDNNNTTLLRSFQVNQSKGAVMIEGGFTISYQVLSFLNVHAGYQFIYLGGIACAPDQIDDDTVVVDTTRLKVNSDPLINGGYIGIIVGF